VFITHYDVREIAGGAGALSATVSPGQAAGGLRAVGAAKRVPGMRNAIARTPAAGVSALLEIHDVFTRLNRLDKVVIAAINGLATGGGCELALACDLRYMAEGAGRIGQPEMALGITPGGGGTQRLTRALGSARALELMLECTLLSPQEAREAGLVHQTFPSAQLLPEAQATAERLARRSPETIAALKRAVYEGGSASLAGGLHVERAGFLATASTPAARKAMGRYADDVDRTGTAAIADPDAYRAWREGTAVDLTT
jgi:enoyl-CoA hydratase/carnithine racemase